MPPPSARWWWIRHAPAAGVEGRFMGRLDAPITDLSAYSPEPLRVRLPQEAVWLTSPLLRCRQTCEWLSPGCRAVAQPDLAEQSFGAWEGRGYDEVWEETKTWESWNAPETLTPPDGESFVELTRRVQAAVERLSVQYAGRDIVAVAHAGTIRAALCMTGMTPAAALQQEIAHLSLTRLSYPSENLSDSAISTAISASCCVAPSTSPVVPPI